MWNKKVNSKKLSVILFDERKEYGTSRKAGNIGVEQVLLLWCFLLKLFHFLIK